MKFTKHHARKKKRKSIYRNFHAPGEIYNALNYYVNKLFLNLRPFEKHSLEYIHWKSATFLYNPNNCITNFKINRLSNIESLFQDIYLNYETESKIITEIFTYKTKIRVSYMI